jgi:hypothetical protein
LKKQNGSIPPEKHTGEIRPPAEIKSTVIGF